MSYNITDEILREELLKTLDLMDYVEDIDLLEKAVTFRMKIWKVRLRIICELNLDTLKVKIENDELSHAIREKDVFILLNKLQDLKEYIENKQTKDNPYYESRIGLVKYTADSIRIDYGTIYLEYNLEDKSEFMYKYKLRDIIEILVALRLNYLENNIHNYMGITL